MTNPPESILADVDAQILESDELRPSAVVESYQLLLAQGMPISQLIERYCHAPDPVARRSLAFVLAQHAARGPDRSSLSAALWTLAEQTLGEDDSTTMNLLAAADLLLAHDTLFQPGEQAPPILSALLIDALHSSTAVQETVIPLITGIYRHGLDSRLPPATRESINQVVPELAGADDEDVQAGARELAEILGRAPHP